MFSFTLILFNRLRGAEGWAGVGRIGMALIAAAPVAAFSWWVAVAVAAASFAGVIAAHGAYFELRTPRAWLGMAYTGLLYTTPASLALLFYGQFVASFCFLISGTLKPVAYWLAKKIVGPHYDFLEEAEYIFGAILGLGLLPAYWGLYGKIN